MDWEEQVLDWSSDSYSGPATGADAAEWQTAAPEGLQEYLRWQIELTPFTEPDLRIALTLLDSIDDDGYLHVSLEEIQQALLPELDASLDEIEAVLHRVQLFDPVGVGARSLAECLQLQLGQFPERTAAVDCAERIVSEHLETLGQGDLKRIAKSLQVAADLVEQAADVIRSLNPRPGTQAAADDVGYIVPDVLVSRRDGRWIVELNPELAPRLRINPYYAELAKIESDAQDQACMRSHLQEARWLLRSLRTRADTLLQVATFIVRHQLEWLDQGDTAMRPLVLREVAEALEMHESTVSRATASKYMHTPRGVFDFRHFFSTGLAAGNATSATAIRAQIKRLIAAEDRTKPLSDGRIAGILADMGLEVARRTVAKYRESMSIPATSDRRASR